jgi:hypothetical protein
MMADKLEPKELIDEQKERQTDENLADLPVSEEQADQAKGGAYTRNGNLQITQL